MVLRLNGQRVIQKYLYVHKCSSATNLSVYIFISLSVNQMGLVASDKILKEDLKEAKDYG